MRKIIVFLVALIIIISGFILYLFLNHADAEPWIEGGMIRHKLIAYFDDGTTGEIAISNPVFSISYEDKKIISIQYILEGMVEGQSIPVNISDYSVYFLIYGNDGLLVNNHSVLSTDNIINTVDGVFVTLMDVTIEVNALFFNDLTDGVYHVMMHPYGMIKYFFNNGWRSSNLPSGLDFNVILDHDQSNDAFIEIIFDTNINQY